MKIPVYQMTFGQDAEGKAGLVFPSEQESHDNHSILFTIPIIEPFHNQFDLLEFLDHQTIYFPFLLDEKYYELEAEINFPELVFTIPEKNTKILFQIDDADFYWRFFPFGRHITRKTKYVANQTKLIPKNDGFLSLLPIDLFEMDELYNEHKGVFVGFTPNFGNSDNFN